VSATALQGNMNIAYCDGSVRSVFVKQGMIPPSATNGKTLTLRPQFVLDESTTNGAMLGGAAIQIEGTRMSPTIAP